MCHFVESPASDWVVLLAGLGSQVAKRNPEVITPLKLRSESPELSRPTLCPKNKVQATAVPLIGL